MHCLIAPVRKVDLPKQRRHRIVIQLPAAGDLVWQAELFPQELRQIRYRWYLLARGY